MNKRLSKKKAKFTLEKYIYCIELLQPYQARKNGKNTAYRIAKNYTYKQFKEFKKS